MLSPSQVIDEYYLEVRCKLLEIAAIYDRYDRAVQRDPLQAVEEDPRWQQCAEALKILNRDQAAPNRAEQVALVFSDLPVDT